MQEYDSLWSLPAIAPRPLLIANGADDPRCPVTPTHPGLSWFAGSLQLLSAPQKVKGMSTWGRNNP